MRRQQFVFWIVIVAVATAARVSDAAIYLNQNNISVAVGANTSPGSFNNTFNNGATINKVIDAPTADAIEFHNQATHIWFTADHVGGGLELEFDFGQEFDITHLHFWNYTGEFYDVDNVDFTFFNSSNNNVGSLSIQPALGSGGGIRAEDIVLAAPLNVQYVTAFLTGSNRQVDFQNIGFTANFSNPVPEPGSVCLWGASLLAGLVYTRRRRRRQAD